MHDLATVATDLHLAIAAERLDSFPIEERDQITSAVDLLTSPPSDSQVVNHRKRDRCDWLVVDAVHELRVSGLQ
jgi:hypothetical protein